MSQANEQQVAHVGRQEHIVRRFLLYDSLIWSARLVSGGEPVVLVAAVPELGMDGREDLLRGRRDLGVREPIDIVKVGLVEDGLA